MVYGENLSRAKRTVLGLILTALGLSAMLLSPYIALELSVFTGILTYHVIFLAGFVSLLYGVGYVLLANHLWGS